MRLTVVGLGKLGSPLAAVLASQGFEVIGVDVNGRFVAAINDGRAPVDEPRLQEMLDRAGGRLSATTDVAEAVARTDVTFVIVPTPSKANGLFSLKYVLEAAEGIGRGLARHDGFHLVVLTSTVMPGDTEGLLVPALEAASGKVCGRDFGVCYSPEFIALGNVVNDLLAPDFILIGETDARSGAILADLCRTLCTNDPPVARMAVVNAEVTKISVNTYVTTRISYANMLSQLCARIPGADVNVVTDAMGLDSRIGRKYMRGAVSYGGPCFPRDNKAFASLARSLGAHALIAEATDAVNKQHLEHLAALIDAHLPDGGTVGILGLSYKPDTGVIEESPGVELARRLGQGGVPMVAYDPQAMPNARAVLADTVDFADSCADCAARADVLVIAMPWAEFRTLTPAHLKAGGHPTVIDCWRILPARDFEASCTYVTVGTGPAADAPPTDLRASRRA
jgi:UDPglucose 6-dehydrogenase